MRFVIEGAFPMERASGANDFDGYDSEDGGTYLVASFDVPNVPLYVKIMSSTEDGGTHDAFLALRGKRVRITIEEV